MSPSAVAAEPPAEGIAVALAEVSKSFAGRVVLDRLSLTVARGEIVSLLGPSGCGKSTTLRIVAGLEPADAGRVLRPTDGLGVVFQDPTLLPWATALDNVTLPFRLSGTVDGDTEARARRALALVGLEAAAGLFPRELSGGMRMRVAIARALVTRPQLLLMDEPFAALDEIARVALDEELLRLRRRQGFSVVFVTHSVPEAVHLSDRILVMAAGPGRIVAELPGCGAAAGDGDPRVTRDFAERCAMVSAALRRSL
ncbi:ABC transporter ATP-binding protein [Siculibacillus lacustris]|uniref:ABC transporter ATP-binding protein n=1 Tax=Siculibacillus lacustris TaxID=1549641 RepID=A0A4Q9VWR2_9HYPH|nr:ABC transporter ATP-binding protein [Siculibacillus lacustris]TBW40779.1 ABC transporter ATP-binding protein [Siculibacillus lacustris]